MTYYYILLGLFIVIIAYISLTLRIRYNILWSKTPRSELNKIRKSWLKKYTVYHILFIIPLILFIIVYAFDRNLGIFKEIIAIYFILLGFLIIGYTPKSRYFLDSPHYYVLKTDNIYSYKIYLLFSGLLITIGGIVIYLI